MNTRPELPVISVIVPVWNRADDLKRCLHSLFEQTLPSEQYEVIVVDNGSVDRTPDVARTFGAVVLLTEPRPGSYTARNRGIAAARGEMLAFIDSDCRADPDWLRCGLAAARVNPHAGIISGRVELEADVPGAQPGLCDRYERMFAFNQQKLAAEGRAVTANWLSPAVIVRDMGGFRAELKSGGDVDLAKRIVAAGHPICYSPDMLVVHPARATLQDLSAKARRVIGGQIISRGELRYPFKSIVRSARVYLYRARDIFKARDKNLRVKSGLLALLSHLLLVQVLEIIRINSGGEPQRQ